MHQIRRVMNHISKLLPKIDFELSQLLLNDALNAIDYDYLLQHNPVKIREEELKISQSIAVLKQSDKLRIEDLFIPSRDQNRDIRLRLYQKKHNKNVPIYLFFHGGAFIFGTPEQYDAILVDLAMEIEAILISVDYRLAPEYPFPAALHDGYDTLSWLANNAVKLGGIPNKIIIGGSSAGGAIAASVTQLAKDLGGPRIAHQYLVYPPMCQTLTTQSMQTLANAPMQTRESAKWMWYHYLNGQTEKPAKYAVPLRYEDFSFLPPATIVTCAIDPLKDEAMMYATKLKQANVETETIEIAEAIHAFDFFETTQSADFKQLQIATFKQIIGQI